MILTVAAASALAEPYPTAASTGPASVIAGADVDMPSDGATFHLVVAIDIEPGWHVYWRNPGDSGAPTKLRITAPDGFDVGPVRFPVPVAFREEFGTTFGYARELVLFVPVRAPAHVDPHATYAFEVGVDYLVCRGSCLMGDADLTVAMSAAAPATFDPRRIDAARRRLPQRVADREDLHIETTDTEVRISGPAPNGEPPVLFPDPSPGVRLAEPHTTVADGRFRVSIPYTFRPPNALGKPPIAAGVLVFGTGRDAPGIEFRIGLDGDGEQYEHDPKIEDDHQEFHP